MLRRSLNKHILLIFFLARQFSAAAAAIVFLSLYIIVIIAVVVCVMCVLHVAPNAIMKHLAFPVKEEEEEKTRNLITNSNVI